jgi:transcription antitermination protein NusB
MKDIPALAEVLSKSVMFLKTEQIMSCRRLCVQFFYQLELKHQLFFNQSEFRIFFQQSDVEEPLYEFSETLVKLTLNDIDALDASISKSLKNWKIERLGKVDLSVLRVALSEIKHRKDVRQNVIIADAVEIAKLFGGENSGGFVNGVLDKACQISAS